MMILLAEVRNRLAALESSLGACSSTFSVSYEKTNAKIFQDLWNGQSGDLKVRLFVSAPDMD